MQIKKREIKSQTTIFIILAIIIVAIIAIYFVFRSNLSGEKVEPEVEPIYSFIENCIQETGENAVYDIGQSGGYFIISEPSTNSGVAYYFDRGNNLMPSKERIEKEISDYVNNMIVFCINNFSDFSDFKLDMGQIESNVFIKPENVVINAKYPITITKGEKNYFFESFKDIEIKVRLNTIYKSVLEMINQQMENNNEICMNCIYGIAEKNNLYIEMLDYDDESIIFYIKDKNSKIKGENYVFRFANRYKE